MLTIAKHALAGPIKLGGEPSRAVITAWNTRSKTDELRDMFAAHIAGGILAGGWADTVPLDDCTHAEQLAAFAYAGANAMLKEREVYRAADAELRAALSQSTAGEDGTVSYAVLVEAEEKIVALEIENTRLRREIGEKACTCGGASYHPGDET